jgi:HEAT repeat protein
LVLSACEDQPVFPYEAVWLLSEFCKAGMAEKTHAIASDPKQDLAVRLACWLGMYRAGHAYPSEEMIQLYQQETDFERRLIILASMRWGSKVLVPTLLTAMDDKNFEIASAAACSVVKFEVPAALPKIEKLLSVEHESPLLVYNALAELKSFDAKLLLRKLLLDSLEGGANRAHLGRLLDAYESAWGVTQYGRMRTSEEVIVRARNGLQFADEAIKKRQTELVKLTANVDSVHEQVKSAEKILELRLSEYRRLSGLLGDEVITADVVQEAKVKLDASRAEMEAVQQNLVDAKARLELLQ